MSAFGSKADIKLFEAAARAERLNQHWVGVIEPRGSWCGFTGPRVYVITRNLMTG
jgi:hypothetical protein